MIKMRGGGVGVSARAGRFGGSVAETNAAPQRPQVAGMTQRFGSLVAPDDISLTLQARAFHAVLREDGAGQNTLVKCVMGYHPPDNGTVLLGRGEQPIP